MKKLLQKLQRLMVCLIFGLVAMSISAEVHLVVNFKDGSSATFPLSDKPVINVVNDGLIIESEESSIEVSFAEIANYVFSEKLPSGMEESPLAYSYRMTNDAIFFSGLRPEEKICIYSANGLLQANVRVDSQGDAIADISSFVAGPYIVQTSTFFFKFIKK